MPLNIVTTYPVRWTKYKVFRDFIQNFYDSVGYLQWEERKGAVYTRNCNPYPEGLPYTHDFGRRGDVFCAYQLLGSNQFDLVGCLHRYKKEDRERNSLYTFDVVRIQYIDKHTDGMII